MKAKQKYIQGAVLMAGDYRIWKFVQSHLLKEYDVDLLGRSHNNFKFRVVDRSAFCHLSPRLAPPAPQSLSIT